VSYTTTPLIFHAKKGGEGTDIDPFIQAGVPGARYNLSSSFPILLTLVSNSLANDNAKYFWFHHSQGDMMTVLNSTVP